MCLLLNTTPEEILTESADIELVKGLIEQEQEKQGIKNPPHRMVQGWRKKISGKDSAQCQRRICLRWSGMLWTSLSPEGLTVNFLL